MSAPQADDYQREARMAAAAILAEHEPLPTPSHSLLVSLLARAWLDGCQAGMEKAQAIMGGPSRVR